MANVSYFLFDLIPSTFKTSIADNDNDNDTDTNTDTPMKFFYE